MSCGCEFYLRSVVCLVFELHVGGYGLLLAVVGEGCEFGVVDEFDVVDAHDVAHSSTWCLVCGEGAEHVCLVALNACIFKGSNEARPLVRNVGIDGGFSYEVLRLVFGTFAGVFIVDVAMQYSVEASAIVAALAALVCGKVRNAVRASFEAAAV